MQAAEGIHSGLRLMQTLTLAGEGRRAEGVALSSRGDVLAVATADADAVLLFRRGVAGSFDPEPCCRLQGPASRLSYPHDVAFTEVAGGDLLAVAQRTGSITLYRRGDADGAFGPEPVFAIAGTTTRLDFSDGVAFVPPRNDYLAACNLTLGTIAFYRRRSDSPVAFEQHPSYELWQSLDQPDGLAFSACGEWLAVANHGNHSVSIFRRHDRIYSEGRFRYGPGPVEVIAEPGLRYPHSTAFSEANHLLVTNAGANYFSVFSPAPGASGIEWSKLPVTRHVVGPESGFRQINSANKMEGGPKGIAAWGRTLALCCPQDGVKMYSIEP